MGRGLTLDIGAAYGTAKAGVGITGMGQRKPSMIMKSLIPIVMAGILGIYGMIVSVILLNNGRDSSVADHSELQCQRQRLQLDGCLRKTLRRNLLWI